MSPMGEFGSAASRLSRNPLGIIALFIVLLYGIAGLVLSTSATALGPVERQPIIWFLVLFPIVVLCVFAWLVSRHHQKLYAPSDYKTDDAFLKTLSPDDQRRRLDAEVAQLESEERPHSQDSSSRGSARTAGDKDRTADLSALQAAAQRYRADAVLAEDLVLRQLESDYGSPIRRHSALKSGAREIELDGLLIRGGQPLGIEVKLVREATVRKSLSRVVDEIGMKALQLEAAAGVPLLVAVVGINLSQEAKALISQRLHPGVLSGKKPIEVKFYDFEELQRTFGVSKSP